MTKAAQAMKKAWEIFKKAGVRTMDAWRVALRKAWAIVKGEVKEEVVYRVNHQPSGGKEWVAEIVGRHPKWKFERKFETPVQRDWSSSGKTGSTYFVLEEGKVYEVCEPYHGRWFVKVENGKAVEINAVEVLAKIA